MFWNQETRSGKDRNCFSPSHGSVRPQRQRVRVSEMVQSWEGDVLLGVDLFCCSSGGISPHKLCRDKVKIDGAIEE